MPQHHYKFNSRGAQAGICTPAKLAPRLKVLRQRGDGFHEVELLMLPIGILDRLELSVGEGRGVELCVENDFLGLPPEENLAWRAAQAFLEASGMELHLALTLTKTIPHGAGLGGGSGNAGGVLVLLRHFFPGAFPVPWWQELAQSLGSDVPFFLDPRPSLARGRGERLTPLPWARELPLLVAMPAFRVSTAQAYQWVHPREGAGEASWVGPWQEGSQNPEDPRWRAASNAFQAPVFARHPLLEAFCARLAAMEGVIDAGLSGTGSALYGLFSGERARDQALKALQAPGWTLFPCRILGHHRYFPEAP